MTSLGKFQSAPRVAQTMLSRTSRAGNHLPEHPTDQVPDGWTGKPGP